MLGLLAQTTHMALMLAAAPLLAGLCDLMRARLLGQSGPHPFQPFRDMRRLLRKQPVLAENASWLFRAAPFAGFALTATAAALVPSFALGMISAPIADLIVVAGLLAAARAISILAAMDCGISAGGAAAGRAATTAVLAEPTLLLIVLALASLAGSTGIDAVAAVTRHGLSGRVIPVTLAWLAACVVAFSTTGRASDELALHAEYSGGLLALTQWTAAVRRVVFLSLFATLFVPFGLADSASPPLWLVGVVAWGVKMVLLAGVAVLADTTVVRRPLAHEHRTVAVALLLALLAAMMLFVGQSAA